MKYMIEVNAKYMVSIEADSPLQAEHKILNENDGCWGALAFDQRMMKTDTFAGAVATCETVSIGELQSMSQDYSEKVSRYATVKDEVKQQAAIIEDLMRQLKDAEETMKSLKSNEIIAQKVMIQAGEKLGVRA